MSTATQEHRKSYELQSEQPPVVLARERYDIAYLESKARYLIDSHTKIEHDNWKDEPEINARTALFEELTAKGHLSRVAFEEAADITNGRTLRRLINGWNDGLPEWEGRRRFYEIVEELVIHETWMDIKAGNLPADTLVITISDYPEMADNNNAHLIGYRALNYKGMARSTYFEEGEDSVWRRVTEQVSRSKSNDRSSQRFISQVTGQSIQGGSQTVLANPLIAGRQVFPDGIVDVQKALDAQAGPNIIYGEPRSEANLHLPEYEDLRRVSAEREYQTGSQIRQLADFERMLDVDYKAGRISYAEKLSQFNSKRREMVDKICVLNPSYARDARGEAAAGHFERASLSMAAGDDSAGIAHLENALAAADPRAGVVCGGEGSEANAKAQNNISGNAKRLYLGAKEERRHWKWSKGVCVVKECPSRPSKTEVGPCSVCRNCQKIFDKGSEPSRVYGAVSIVDMMIESMREFNREFDAAREQKGGAAKQPKSKGQKNT